MYISRHGILLVSLILCSLCSTLETLNTRGFWKVDAEGTHVHAVEKGAKAVVEAVQTLVQELQVHHVGFQIGHSISEFSKGRLKGLERDGGIGIGGRGCGSGDRGAEAGA
jgi:hypothetical protein